MLVLLRSILSLEISKSLTTVLIGLLAFMFYIKVDFEKQLNSFKNDIVFSIDKRLVKIEAIVEENKNVYKTKKDKVKK